jgi:hypothetical protein
MIRFIIEKIMQKINFIGNVKKKVEILQVNY